MVRSVASRVDARWSEPSGLLAALGHILAAPRAEALDRFADEIVDLVPHVALAVRTADCARTPIKTSGPRALTGRITADELHTIAERPRGEGATRERVVLAGEPRTAVIVDARPPNGRGALLVVLPSAPTDESDACDDAGDDAPALELLARLWSVVSAAEAARADATGPNLLAGNQAAADARRATSADLRRAHTTTLLALLAVLRSPRRDDAAARASATDLASDALLDLRRDRDDEHALATDSAQSAFNMLRTQLEPLQRSTDAVIELVGPDRDDQVPQAVGIAARASTEALVGVALEQREPTRVRVAWTLTGETLQVSLRDDGTAHPPAESDPRSDPKSDLGADRVEALGGHVHTDTVPGWGTTTTVTLPLDLSGQSEPDDPGALRGLAPRELEVLAGLSDGLRNREIADRLHLSEHTVKFHVRNVLDKLRARHRGEAAVIARTFGLTLTPVPESSHRGTRGS